jgi:hypothetical protein
MSLQGPKQTQNQSQNSNFTGQGSNSSTAMSGGQSQSTNQSSSNQSGTNVVQSGGSQSQTYGGSSTTSPNLPSWYTSFLSSIPGQYQTLASQIASQSSKPLYGQPQQAAFQNNLNATQHQAQQQLTSQLASQGALNSGRAAQMQTGLALGGQEQLSDYLSKAPIMNAQNQQALQSQQLGVTQGQAGFTSPIGAFGTTTTNQGTNNGVQTGTQTGQTSSSTSSITDLINQFVNASNQNGTSSQSGSNSQSGTTTNATSANLGTAALMSGIGALAQGLTK